MAQNAEKPHSDNPVYQGLAQTVGYRLPPPQLDSVFTSPCTPAEPTEAGRHGLGLTAASSASFGVLGFFVFLHGLGFKF